MIAALLLLAQTAAPPASPPEAHPLAIRSDVDPEPFTLGQTFEWRIEIEHEPRDVYTLADPKLDPLQLVSPPETRRTPSGDHALTRFVLRLADLTTLEPKLPDLMFKVDGPDGPRQLVLSGRPLKLRSLVKEEGAPNAEHAHHGPKPPVPVMVRAWLWLGLLLAAAAIVAAVFAARWWRKKRATVPQLPAAPPLSPEDQAMKDLVRLREGGGWSRQTIFALSEITRTYLGRRFAFDALDLTTEELLAEVRRRALEGLDVPALERELRWEDLVKFARLEPEQHEVRAAISGAIELVNRTRPQRMEAA